MGAAESRLIKMVFPEQANHYGTLVNGNGLALTAKGAWRDDIFVKSLWRTVNHAEVCLRACSVAPQAAPASSAIET